MSTYPDLKHQCCRLKAQTTERIINRILDNCDLNSSNLYPYNVEENTMQFDMSKEDEGFPCIHLDNEIGCKIHETKPSDCHAYPTTQNSISGCVGCSYTFTENNERSGVCNGCNII